MTSDRCKAPDPESTNLCCLEKGHDGWHRNSQEAITWSDDHEAPPQTVSEELGEREPSMEWTPDGPSISQQIEYHVDNLKTARVGRDPTANTRTFAEVPSVEPSSTTTIRSARRV